MCLGSAEGWHCVHCHALRSIAGGEVQKEDLSDPALEVQRAAEEGLLRRVEQIPMYNHYVTDLDLGEFTKNLS